MKIDSRKEEEKCGEERDLLIYRGKKKLDLYDLQPRSLQIDILSATDSSNPSDHINTVFSSTIGGARSNEGSFSRMEQEEEEE